MGMGATSPQASKQASVVVRHLLEEVNADIPNPRPHSCTSMARV